MLSSLPPLLPLIGTLLPKPPTHVCTYTHPEGKPLPSEMKKDEAKLRREVELEDDNTAVPRTHMDDEYAHAGETDPKVLITTSREPSSRLVQFSKVRQGEKKASG